MLQFSGLLLVVVCFCVFCWGGHFWSFETVGLDEFLKLGWEAGRSARNHLESFGIDENWVLKNRSVKASGMCVCVCKACKSLLTGSQGGSIVGVRKGNPSFLSYSSETECYFFLTQTGLIWFASFFCSFLFLAFTIVPAWLIEELHVAAGSYAVLRRRCGAWRRRAEERNGDLLYEAACCFEGTMAQLGVQARAGQDETQLLAGSRLSARW